MIYYQTAQYENAISLFRHFVEQKEILNRPYIFLIASYAASGRLKEARTVLAAFRKRSPQSIASRTPKAWVRTFAFKNKRDNDRLLADLAKAGLK